MSQAPQPQWLLFGSAKFFAMQNDTFGRQNDGGGDAERCGEALLQPFGVHLGVRRSVNLDLRNCDHQCVRAKPFKSQGRVSSTAMASVLQESAHEV